MELTSNYLKLILTYLATPGNNGVLVHCISGWDRTPLYVSLIRLSLWADGAIHQNLSALEILYLTVNYDWFLFHHYLADRTRKGEDIFYFCFVFLKHITSEEFSISEIIANAKLQTYSSSQKICIKNDEDNDDSHSGSFGSCGNSWEMTGAYLNQYTQQRSVCTFITDSTLDKTIAELAPITPPRRKTSNSDNSYFLNTSNDDLDFPFDEDDGFVLLADNTSTSASKDDTSENTFRATRLEEVWSIMLKLYPQYVSNTV